MSKRNKKSMNNLFGKRRVGTSVPDERWAMPSELIGIEIECENFADSYSASVMLAPEWAAHSDGSLRDGIEWVLSGPLSGAALATAIDKFFDRQFDYTMSERTSVHIHVNASDDLSVDQFRNIFTLMFLIEPAVFRWADENRKWCGYCQPLTDFSPSRISEILSEDDSEAAFVQAVGGAQNSDRYYGLNVAAYKKHGTLEFRYFPCTRDKATLTSWVQFVMEVKRTGLTYEGPDQLLMQMETPEAIQGFIRKHFTHSGEQLLSLLDLNDCLHRAATLSALIETDTSDVVGTNRHRPGQAETKALTKLLTKKFGGKKAKASPRTVADTIASLQGQAYDSSDSYERMMRRVDQLRAEREARMAEGTANPVPPPTSRERPQRTVPTAEDIVTWTRPNPFAISEAISRAYWADETVTDDMSTIFGTNAPTTRR